MDDRESILSHGEREVARHLRSHPDAAPAEVAAARDADAATVEAAIARIREKTARAVATLDESPFASEVAGAFDAETVRAVVAALEAGAEDGFEAGAGLESEPAGESGGEVDPPLGGRLIERGMATPFRVEYHDRIASTNDRARELAEAGEQDVVVLTDEQTGGRGRRGREWVGPSGGVWLSILLAPDLAPEDVPVLTLAAGVAVTQAVRDRGVAAGLKWPNDVLVPLEGDGTGEGEADETGSKEGEGGTEHKLVGVLTERVDDRAVVGVGVNANVSLDELPPGATSLRALVGDVDRRQFVRDLLEAFDDLRADPEGTMAAWRELALTLGRRVRIETPTGEVVGEAVDIERPGRLVVETDEGTVRVEAGDCEHLRPV